MIAQLDPNHLITSGPIPTSVWKFDYEKVRFRSVVPLSYALGLERRLTLRLQHSLELVAGTNVTYDYVYPLNPPFLIGVTVNSIVKLNYVTNQVLWTQPYDSSD